MGVSIGASELAELQEGESKLSHRRDQRLRQRDHVGEELLDRGRTPRPT